MGIVKRDPRATHIDVDTGKMYMWDGAQWILLENPPRPPEPPRKPPKRPPEGTKKEPEDKDKENEEPKGPEVPRDIGTKMSPEMIDRIKERIKKEAEEEAAEEGREFEPETDEDGEELEKLLNDEEYLKALVKKVEAEAHAVAVSDGDFTHTKIKRARKNKKKSKRDFDAELRKRFGTAKKLTVSQLAKEIESLLDDIIPDADVIPSSMKVDRRDQAVRQSLDDDDPYQTTADKKGEVEFDLPKDKPHVVCFFDWSGSWREKSDIEAGKAIVAVLEKFADDNKILFDADEDLYYHGARVSKAVPDDSDWDNDAMPVVNELLSMNPPATNVIILTDSDWDMCTKWSSKYGIGWDCFSNVEFPATLYTCPGQIWIFGRNSCFPKCMYGSTPLMKANGGTKEFDLRLS